MILFCPSNLRQIWRYMRTATKFLSWKDAQKDLSPRLKKYLISSKKVSASLYVWLVAYVFAYVKRYFHLIRHIVKSSQIERKRIKTNSDIVVFDFKSENWKGAPVGSSIWKVQTSLSQFDFKIACVSSRHAYKRFDVRQTKPSRGSDEYERSLESFSRRPPHQSATRKCQNQKETQRKTLSSRSRRQWEGDIGGLKVRFFLYSTRMFN